MKYVIWSTIPKPHNGHPLDRPGIAKGVCPKDRYESGLAFLDGESTQVEDEFEVESPEEAAEYFSAFDDATHEKEDRCSICVKEGCEVCLPKEEEHSLARRIGCRPYSELTPSERGGIAAYLVRFEKEFGKPENFNPRDYWWKAMGKNWEPFNTKAVIADEPLLV